MKGFSIIALDLSKIFFSIPIASWSIVACRNKISSVVVINGFMFTDIFSNVPLTVCYHYHNHRNYSTFKAENSVNITV